MEKKHGSFDLIKPFIIEKKLADLLKSPAKHNSTHCSEVRNGESVSYANVHYVVTGNYAEIYFYKYLKEIEEILGCPYTIEHDANTHELIITPLAIDLR